MNQTEQILKHLKREPITPIDALNSYGCFRLAARINDLRDRGYLIATDIEQKSGKRYAKYRLIRKRAKS